MNDMAVRVIDFAEKHLGEFKISNGQVSAKTCPFCHGGENHDAYTFYVGLYNGAYCCHRGKCNRQGSFADLCKQFGELPPENIDPVSTPFGRDKKKNYVKPVIADYVGVTDQILTYFATRRISEQTVTDWRIASDKHGYIVFPF